jgi:pyridoxamine 5'-phosphate oxidase
MALATMTSELADAPLVPADPFRLFAEWLELARASEPNDPNAMALATVDRAGVPNVRIVLLKSFDADGFVFYTSTQSEKGRELGANMCAAGTVHWKTLGRQVRFRGDVTPVSDAEADAYFASRPRESRIGAWASTHPLPG